MTQSTTVTYCPEDNKLRLYIGRVPREEYLSLRTAGYKSTPKQDCDFVASWTVAREDIALEYLEDNEDIGDENYSPAERSVDRAERFAGYRDKRREEATGHADNFENGPQAFGNQNQQRAERQAKRHDRQRTKAVSQWSKAEYWQQRTAGVIDNALFKLSPKVRRGRVVDLEKIVARYAKADRDSRHLQHCKFRLSYELQMLEAEGGTAISLEMVVGGFIGSHQIYKVNKSNLTGQVVSVSVMMGAWWNESDIKPRPLNIQRLGEDAYRPPTEEELTTFKQRLKEIRAEKRKASKGAPKLINPTPEAAEKLQQSLIAVMLPKVAPPTNPEHTDYHHNSRVKLLETKTINATQAAYSARSKGSYSICETVGVLPGGKLDRYHHDKENHLFKVRIFTANECYTVDRIVIITDKPQKELPNWEATPELEKVDKSWTM